MRLVAHVPEALGKQIKIRAVEEGRPIGHLMRDAAEDYLKRATKTKRGAA